VLLAHYVVTVDAAEGGSRVEIVSTLVVSLAAAVANGVLWLLGWWLQLRAQDRRDEARLRYLTAALALPAGRELAEVAPDGASLYVIVATGAEGRRRG
jgi:hypothetical protein